MLTTHNGRVIELPPAKVQWRVADREETDPCQRGTVGCCVDHPDTGPETDCEGW